MVYGHTIKRNNVLYKAGEYVPSDVKPSKATETVAEPKEAPAEHKESVRRGRKPKTED